MPTANFGPYAVITADGLYVVIDRMSRETVALDDGNPAAFVLAKDAFLWTLCKLKGRAGK
jgi:hypothetical protein